MRVRRGAPAVASGPRRALIALDTLMADPWGDPGVAVGGSQLAAATALVRRAPRARRLTTTASGLLLGWIVAQLAMIGNRSPLQPAVLAWAIGSAALGRRLDC